MIRQLPDRYEGTSTLDFRRDGLVWTLRVPLGEIQEAQAPANEPG